MSRSVAAAATRTLTTCVGWVRVVARETAGEGVVTVCASQAGATLGCWVLPARRWLEAVRPLIRAAQQARGTPAGTALTCSTRGCQQRATDIAAGHLACARCAQTLSPSADGA